MLYTMLDCRILVMSTKTSLYFTIETWIDERDTSAVRFGRQDNELDVDQQVAGTYIMIVKA